MPSTLIFKIIDFKGYSRDDIYQMYYDLSFSSFYDWLRSKRISFDYFLFFDIDVDITEYLSDEYFMFDVRVDDIGL